jgi:hypothetical protein
MSPKIKISEASFQQRVERGKRARKIREEILNMTRTELAKKYSIPISTIQSWEDANFGGMVDNSAQRLSSIFKAEGIDISPEWLMYGTGEPPAGIVKNREKLSEESAVAQELRLFYQLNENAVHFMITDDAMAPWLMPGDYAAGRWYFDKHIEKAVGYPAIIQLTSGNMLVRILRKSNEPDLYTLSSTNVNKETVHNAKIFSAAPIMWLRKVKLSGEF